MRSHSSQSAAPRSPRSNPPEPGGPNRKLRTLLTIVLSISDDGSEPRYDGESMARKGIVAVSINYRLNVFGFLSHPHAADSVLSYVQNAQRRLTALNVHLIHVLYDPRLAAGTPAGPASQQACRLLGERMRSAAADIDAVCSKRSGPAVAASQ